MKLTRAQSISVFLLCGWIIATGLWSHVEIWQRSDAMEFSGKGAWNGTLVAACEMGYWSCHVVRFEEGYDFVHTNPIPFIGTLPDLYHAYSNGWIRYSARDICEHAGRYGVHRLVDPTLCAGTRRKFWTLFGLKYEDEL